MFIFEKRYQPSLIVAAAAHIVLFFFLFTSFAFNSSLSYVVKSGNAQQAIVQAVAVNQQQVQQAVQQLHDQQQAQATKLHQQEEHFREMQRQAEIAKETQEKALKNLQQLKARQQKLQAEQQLAQQKAAERLAALKQQQAQQQQKVAQQKQHLAQLEQQQQTATQNYKLQQQKLVALKQKQQTQKNLQSQDAQDLLKQELQQEQSQLNQAKAAYIQGIVNKYNALVVQAIYQNWFIPPNIDPKLSVKLQVNVAQGGAVSSVTVIKSSGNNALDQSATMAVYKASPLPIPTNNPDVYKQFQQFSITMTPSQISDVG